MVVHINDVKHSDVVSHIKHVDPGLLCIRQCVIKAFFKVAYGFGEKAAPAAFHPWQAQATFEAARCFEVLQQPDQARKLYAELVARYPDSQQTPVARKRLEALGPGGGKAP